MLIKLIAWACIENPPQAIIKDVNIPFINKGSLVLLIMFAPFVISRIPLNRPFINSSDTLKMERSGDRKRQNNSKKLMIDNNSVSTEKNIIKLPIINKVLIEFLAASPNRIPNFLPSSILA